MSILWKRRLHCIKVKLAWKKPIIKRLICTLSEKNSTISQWDSLTKKQNKNGELKKILLSFSKTKTSIENLYRFKLIGTSIWRHWDLLLSEYVVLLQKQTTNSDEKHRISIKFWKQTVSKPLKPNSIRQKQRYNQFSVFRTPLLRIVSSEKWD